MREATLLIAAALLAGCGGPAPPSAAVPDAALATLADYAGCRWTYPDGTPPSCTGALELPLQEGPPLGAECVHRQGNDQGPAWELYWSPADDRHGLRMLAGGQAPFGVVARVRSGDTIGLYTWTMDQDDAFVLLPDPLAGAGDPTHRNITLRFTSYRLDLAWESDAHALEAWQPLWSLYENQFWLAYLVRTAGGEFTFPATTSRVLERHTNGQVFHDNWHEPYPLNVTGDDFRLETSWEFRGFGRSPYPLQGLAPDPFCTYDPNRLVPPAAAQARV